MRIFLALTQRAPLFLSVSYMWTRQHQWIVLFRVQAIATLRSMHLFVVEFRHRENIVMTIKQLLYKAYYMFVGHFDRWRNGSGLSVEPSKYFFSRLCLIISSACKADLRLFPHALGSELIHRFRKLLVCMRIDPPLNRSFLFISTTAFPIAFLFVAILSACFKDCAIYSCWM